MTEALTNVDSALRRGWHALCRSADVTEQPSSHVLLDVPYVVFRVSDGSVAVFVDRCPHRFAPLSLGRCDNDVLHCAYHGWSFNAAGTCVAIPALGDGPRPSRAHLAGPAGVVESHSMVFIAPDDPLQGPPDILAASNPAFVRGDLPIIDTRGSAGLLADNFLDVAHFPFVHAATFGASDEESVPNYDVQRDGFNFTASYEHTFSNREDPGVASGERPLLQRRRLTYRYHAPFHLELEINFLDAGGCNVIGFFLTPLDGDHVRIFSSLWRDDLHGSKAALDAAVAFEVAVVREDLAIQSRYHRLELPLDVTAEVHTRADRTTLELRRALADFVNAAR